MTRRCSVSITSGGELSRSRSGWPRKSVTVTNRSSGWPCGQQRAALRPVRHRVERVEQQCGAAGAAERRFEPARADEIARAWPRPRRDARARRSRRSCRAAAGDQPGDRHRPDLGEACEAAHARVEQAVDIGHSSHSSVSGSSDSAGRDRLGEEDGVDPARAGAGEDVDQDAQVDPASPARSRRAARDRLPRLPSPSAGIAERERLAGAGEPPDLLGDAVHVDGEADAAVADQSEPQLLLPHAPQGDRKGFGCRAAQGKGGFGRFPSAKAQARSAPWCGGVYQFIC